MYTLNEIYSFVENNKKSVENLLMESKVRKMLELMKLSGFKETLQEMPKSTFLSMTEKIRDILGVPCMAVQNDIFELTMMVDVLLLRISNITGNEAISSIDSNALIDVFGSYEYIQLYLENQFDIKL